jgi:hypothetical protein
MLSNINGLSSLVALYKMFFTLQGDEFKKTFAAKFV